MNTNQLSKSLLYSELVPVNKLAQIFKKRTNSYKYLFFLSLLQSIKNNNFNLNIIYSLSDLQAEMLKIAWYPYKFFKLSFGNQDKIAEKLEKLPPIELNYKIDNRDLIRQHIIRHLSDEELLKYVPYRLIRVFFEEQTKNMADSKVDQMIHKLAIKSFDEFYPIYYIDANKKNLIVHPYWLHFLHINYSIVYEWTLWEWLQYMQKRNPNVINLSSKLLPPIGRGTLSDKRKYWKKVIETDRYKFRCPYSNEVIKTDKFELDHFLPWSFVVHNRLWNLIPTLPEVNLQKSDNIPSLDYIDNVIEQHHIAISISKTCFKTKKWNNYMEDYITDLKISETDIKNVAEFRNKYHFQVESLTSLAKAQGFFSDWVYRSI